MKEKNTTQSHTMTATTTREYKQIRTGWIDKSSGHVYKTAIDAMRAARRESKRNAASGIGIVIVEWEPTTTIGRIVIEAIGNN